MNISDFAAVDLSGDDLVAAWALPGGGVALILLAILAAVFWNIDPDKDEFGERRLKGMAMTLLALGGLTLLVLGGAQHSKWNAPVRAANGAAFQDWAKDSYGVAISEDDAVGAVRQAGKFPEKEHTLTVRDPDGRMQDVLLRVEAGGDLYLMDPTTRAELEAR